MTELIRWFDVHERPLPWRRSTPWGVLVSEFMLQQTPVDRVIPVWSTWLDRWPTPTDLAAASVGDALRAWGRLGYPRRARRLHEASVAITARHGGQVPDDSDSLRALPGVGDYTAAAVLAFAYGRHAVVLDTNVRRVLARAVEGSATPTAHITTAERRRAAALWPTADRRSARWSAAVMEFGAVVCTARTPACTSCPIRRSCAWLAAGQPPATASARRQPEYRGSHRQARGAILALLRESTGSASSSAVEQVWPDTAQRLAAIGSLLDDGLIVTARRGSYALPD